jgi:transcriptional regulator with PAS, ATPase and Fis domain
MAESTQAESVHDARGSGAPVPGALVVFSHRAPMYRTVVLTPDASHVVGRNDLGGVAVPDEKVSKQHAELRYARGVFQVRDLGSRNGTFVDGQRVEGVVEAKPGSVLRLAQTVLVLMDDLRDFLVGHVAHDGFVVGPRLQRVLDQATQAAAGGAHLLIRGESGSGKELVARRFHAGVGAKTPFVAVNCAAIPATVAEGQLFGAVKGGYTDSKQDRRGFLGEADGGVLFLDEIAELDLGVQAKLLRAVETGEVVPVGASTAQKVSVRIVAASHRSLRDAMADKKFRDDLYYRLSQHEAVVPPLRERREELPWLMQHALKSTAMELHATGVEAALLRPWPGNVRELLSETGKAASRAAAESSTVLRAEHLGEDAGRPVGRGGPEARPVAPTSRDEGPSKEQVLGALERSGGNVSAAARALGLHRTQLNRLRVKFGLMAPAEESAGNSPEE